LDAKVEINSAWEMTKANIKISAKENILDWRSISQGSTKDGQN
jgi:hypothetical protein